MNLRRMQKEETVADAKRWIKSEAGKKSVIDVISKSQERCKKDKTLLRIEEKDLHVPVTI